MINIYIYIEREREKRKEDRLGGRERKREVSDHTPIISASLSLWMMCISAKEGRENFSVGVNTMQRNNGEKKKKKSEEKM